MKQGNALAIVGATSLVGEAVVELLSENPLPVERHYLLDDAESVGRRMALAGEYLPVEPVADFDFSRVGLALFCDNGCSDTIHLERALEAGCRVVDLCQETEGSDTGPVVVPEINADAVGEGDRLIRSPIATAVPLLLALKPLNDACGLEQVVVSTYQSVSGRGQEGVTELAGQTAALLGGQPIQREGFAKQIAFNVLPWVGEAREAGACSGEVGLAQAIKGLLKRENLSISVTAAWVPTFYGDAFSVWVRSARPVDAKQAKRLFSRTPGLRLVDHEEEIDYPSALDDAIGQDEVVVGRIRQAGDSPDALSFWLVADNVRRGAAMNGVKIAGILLKNHL